MHSLTCATAKETRFRAHEQLATFYANFAAAMSAGEQSMPYPFALVCSVGA